MGVVAPGASELLLLAERVDAERAREVGILNKVVPDGELMAEAERMATRLAELSPVFCFTSCSLSKRT